MKFKTALANNKLIGIAFILPVLLVIMAFIVTGIYPFGEKQIAVIDMYHQYVPFLSELQYKLQEGGSLFYTWNGAGGSNFWNLMAYYGASPLNLLLALFPQNYVMEGITVILLIKIGLAGSFMALYLRYLGKSSDMGTVVFATLYALCSYVMAYYWCIMWMDAVALLPLCILGLNRIIDDGRAVMYTVSLGIIVFTNYYMAIMVCIFILCYYPVLYFLKVPKGSVRLCVTTTAKAVGYSFLGIAMGAVMLLPTYIGMHNAYYFSSEMPENWHFYNDVLDILNQMLPYSQLTFRDGLPNLYCGIVVVIFVVLYVCSGSIALREKLLNLGFLTFLLLSLNINKLDFIWHGLHFPNQLPYRYTFVICFILIGMAYKVFLQIDTVRVKHLWVVLVAGIGYYLAAQKLMKEQIGDMSLFFYGGVAWLLLYCIVIILYRKGSILKNSFVLLMVVLVIAEMGANTCESFDRIGNTYRSTYFENSADICKLVETTNQEFARTEMDQLYTLNNPAMYHYKGLSQFSSSINANMTELMEKVGLDGSPGRNRFNYNQTNPVTNSMLNVKYLIAKNLEIKDPDFEQVGKSGYSRLYESKYPLSIGYMTGNEIRTWNTNSENPFHVLNDYVRASTVNKYQQVFHSLGEPTITTKNATAKITANGKFTVKSDGTEKAARVTLTYTSDKTQKYYVFFEADNAKSINVSNGNKVEDIEIRNDCGSIVNIGSIEAGKTFTVTIDYKGGKVGNITGHVCYLDQEAWDGAYEILSRNMMQVTASGDTYLEGRVEAEQDGVLVTSVPYEKGWTLAVDGIEKNINELTGGVLISVPLTEGEHHIRLEFRPPGIVAGAAASGIAIVLLAIFQLIGRHRRKLLYEVLKEEDVTISSQESISDSSDDEISDNGM